MSLPIEIVMSLIGLIITGLGIWNGILESKLKSLRLEFNDKLALTEKIHTIIQDGLKEDILLLRGEIRQLSNDIKELTKQIKG